jgi:hypothetical protein
MSEINSIAQGTYTLGQTSATTYQAGPGISITQPSEGTVRISNDETVLWSGNGAVSAALSEPMTNFNRLKIKLGNLGGTDGTQYVEVPAVPSAIKNLTYNAGGGSNFYFVGLYCSADENSITINKEAALLKAFGSTAYGGQGEVTGYKPALHEVIGINRISGGNA